MNRNGDDEIVLYTPIIKTQTFVDFLIPKVRDVAADYSNAMPQAHRAAYMVFACLKRWMTVDPRYGYSRSLSNAPNGDTRLEFGLIVVARSPKPLRCTKSTYYICLVTGTAQCKMEHPVKPVVVRDIDVSNLLIDRFETTISPGQMKHDAIVDAWVEHKHDCLIQEMKWTETVLFPGEFFYDWQ